MNTIQLNRIMAKASLLIVLTLLMTSCLFDKLRKDKDPEPELAGTYQVSRFTEDGGPIYNLPDSFRSVTVVVTRPSDTQITFQFNLIVSGQASSTNAVTVEIRKASGRNYDIFASNLRLGYINGTDFVLDFQDVNGRTNVIADK